MHIVSPGVGRKLTSKSTRNGFAHLKSFFGVKIMNKKKKDFKCRFEIFIK